MKKRILTTACALALMAGMPASADNFFDRERAAFCVLETAMDVLARMVYFYECAAMAGRYEFKIEVLYNGDGYARLDVADGDDGIDGGLRLDVELSERTTKGERWTVTGEATDLDGLEVGPIAGTCTNHSGDEIMVGTSVTTVAPYSAEAKFINHLYRNLDETRPFDFVAKGTDVVLRRDVSSDSSDWPRALWKQTVKYLRPDGEDGYITMRKSPLVGTEEASCNIRLRNTSVDDFNERFQTFDGIIRVR